MVAILNYFKNKKSGFTLVEIMIVISIIAILAWITIPNALRSRMTTNEIAAITGLQTISKGAQLYYNDRDTYLGNITILTDAVPSYVIGFAGSGSIRSKVGYDFSFLGDVDSFNAVANSEGVNFGQRNFCTDQRGSIYQQPLATVYTASASGNCAGSLIE